MPSIYGGDQCDEDYAPHMYICGNYVWQTAQTVRWEGQVYRIGRTSSEEIVCSRRPVDSHEPEQLVPQDEIPKQVLAAILEKTFKGTAKKVQDAVSQLNR